MTARDAHLESWSQQLGHLMANLRGVQEDLHMLKVEVDQSTKAEHADTFTPDIEVDLTQAMEFAREYIRNGYIEQAYETLTAALELAKSEPVAQSEHEYGVVAGIGKGLEIPACVKYYYIKPMLPSQPEQELVAEFKSPHKRWEDGDDHDPRSKALYKFIADTDFKHCGDSFCFKSGGDGDNGETLMFILDCWFAQQHTTPPQREQLEDEPVAIFEATTGLSEGLPYRGTGRIKKLKFIPVGAELYLKRGAA